MITALVALGILCIGASAYLVTVTVRYYQGMVRDATRRTVEAVDLTSPFYGEFVQARKQGNRARVVALARELEVALARGARASAEDFATRARVALAAQIRREDGLVELSLSAPPPADLPGGAVVAQRHDDYPEAGGAWIWVVSGPELVEPGRLALAPADPPWPPLQLVATFAQSPALDARYQRLGQLRRELEFVSLDGGRLIERGEFGNAVFRAIMAASLLVLGVAFVDGFMLARATTRKLGQLTDVILRVASGDLRARVPELGQDELGHLGAAFNGMLVELDSAAQKLSYLQRVGAWPQGARGATGHAGGAVRGAGDQALQP